MKKVALLLCLSANCSLGFAQSRDQSPDRNPGRKSGSYQNYGMAGCGLGSLVFDDRPGMVQILAGTLNTLGGQTFAITSGTSNCGESGKLARVEQFIDINKLTLEKELSRGEGEALSSLAHLVGCNDKAFSSELSKNYTEKFPLRDATVSELTTVVQSTCEI